MSDGTALYHDMLAHEYDEERRQLMATVWDGTPWMVDAYTGGHTNHRDREYEIRDWCTDQFGPEALPLHGRPGKWQRGSATIHGYTWMGFATEEMMQRFIGRWGQTETSS